MQKIILKFLFVFATIKYPNIRKDYRYYIRDNYFCRFYQFKFFLSDYIQRKKYKETDFHGEFDQELRYVIPFAYWHHLNGTLKRTVSCKNTKELYFFSEDHEEKYEDRDWKSSYENYSFPNMTHSISFSYKKWARVPFKEFYRNEIFVFQKPILVIANKYNIEWDGPPLNYLDIADLERIISLCGHKYQIVYNRPLASQIVSDNSETLDLKEYPWLKSNYPEVILMNDLYENYSHIVNNFNHLQLMVYANCNNFISMHGGTAAFASCFEGANIILSQGEAKEVHLNEFSTIFPALSGASILHAADKDQMFSFIENQF